MNLRLALSVIFGGLIGCSTGPALDSSTAEGGFALGEKYEKDERYEEALSQFNIVKNKHPYSRLATDAKIRIAEIHFKREDFVEAQSEYEAFKELHPDHERIDYVTYRLGLSLFKQLPSTIDRDLSLADKALLYFDEVISSYPKSPHVAEAQESRRKILEMLAEKELYVAEFYLKREKYDSALGRFEDLLQKFPQSKFAARALRGGAISAARLKDESKYREFVSRLERDFADSRELRDAKEEGRAN